MTEDIGMLIKQLYDAKEKRANEQLKSFDLTFSQFRILIYLHEQSEPTSMKAVEREFSLTQQTVAGLVKRLESKGFLDTQESPTDKRAKEIRLTEKGEASYQEAAGAYHQAQTSLTKGLSAAEEMELQRMLKILLNNMSSVVE